MLFQDTQLSPLLRLCSLETAYMSQIITDMFRVHSQFQFLIVMIYHLIFNVRYTMDATSGSGNAYPSVFNVVRVAQSIVSCIVFCRRLFFVFFLMAIVLSVLRFSASDYPFDIFKFFIRQSHQANKHALIHSMNAVAIGAMNIFCYGCLMSPTMVYLY